MFLCKYLWILVFVWALVFSGLRYYQSASIECNGVTQKIHMRKFAVAQGLVSIMEKDRFHDQRPLDKPKWKCQGPWVRADAQCCYSTWLEELASESNTIQAQEILVCQGRLQAIYR